MNRRRVLVSTVSAFALFGVAASAIPFVSSLAPSERAKDYAKFVFQIPKLEPGHLYTLQVNGRLLFILRPDQKQLESISQLESHVWDTTKGAYVNELDAFVYWGMSTRWGCDLQEKPAEDSGLREWSVKAQWLGGYWDPRCEVSYDYAGRALRRWEFSYNGYADELPNLRKPNVKISGRTLVVSLL